LQLTCHAVTDTEQAMQTGWDAATRPGHHDTDGDPSYRKATRGHERLHLVEVSPVGSVLVLH